jgi:hypothetical protein
MVKNKYEKLTSRTLEHILGWGDILCHQPAWTKWDANTYHLIKQEVKRLKQEEYQRNKTLAACPYADPNVPYHLT